MVANKAWISWNSIMGKHWIIVWSARTGGVLTRWGILLERGGQVQVLKMWKYKWFRGLGIKQHTGTQTVAKIGVYLIGNGHQHLIKFFYKLFECWSLCWYRMPTLSHLHVAIKQFECKYITLKTNIKHVFEFDWCLQFMGAVGRFVHSMTFLQQLKKLFYWYPRVWGSSQCENLPH